jgi:hypothetical protein
MPTLLNGIPKRGTIIPKRGAIIPKRGAIASCRGRKKNHLQPSPKVEKTIRRQQEVVTLILSLSSI